MARTKRLLVPVTLLEKKQIDREAKEAKLNLSDYVRSKLGLRLARGKRNNYEKAPEPPPGDPDNAVDVEELARELFAARSQVPSVSQTRGVRPTTMADARREAKRRLMAANQK